MKKDFTIIGHRGIAALYPENTIPSFLKAIEYGVDAIEFDVHPTRDGHLVITHDHTVERCSNGRGAVKDKTLAELKSLDFGSYKSPRFAGTRIPTLEEALEAIWDTRPDLPLLIELKEDDQSCTRQVVETIRRYRGLEKVLILSFLSEQLRVVRAMEPALPLQGFPHRYLRESCVDLYSFINKVCVWNSEVTATETDYFHHLGLLVDVYPVDTEEQLEKVLPLEIDSITTNNIEFLLPLLQKRNLR